MLQEVFRIPILGLPVYGFGLMVVIGFLLGVELTKRLARARGLNADDFVNASLLALVVGIAGARISNILENWSEYVKPGLSIGEILFQMINIRAGGLTYYGGFLLAFPTLVLWAKWKKIPLRPGMDIIAPALMIGLGFGRIGCFLNGCCFGAVCNVPWAVTFPYASYAYEQHFEQEKLTPPPALLRVNDRGRVTLVERQTALSDPVRAPMALRERSKPVHPTQLYSALTAFLIAGACYAFYTVNTVPGRVFAFMLVAEGVTRFTIELLRVEPTWLGPFTLSMLIGIGLLVIGVLLWLGFGRPGQRPDEPSQPLRVSADPTTA
jgi:phosphatidylglycerol:prolipoprotein diacylglycerol transferase